ncbi:hypothetical protein [Chenggangzhangella methanolivorans]|uniref:Secreted protein n=2 Tax=Chenggangzhangella methanolivorans TaxID=1437009 RepID=A0A9E6UKF9_9HYPH|nr:hypothetical protein [Chenggangzhangella methanolivorans]QZN99266.1 hypothetical protein K6K41_21085 [Chenggangzhangella methanolivorans]
MRSICAAAAFVFAIGCWSATGVGPAAAQSGPQARAFGLVIGERFSFRQGFKSLRKAGTGLYCLKLGAKLMPFRELITPSVTVEYGNSSGKNLSAYYDVSGCDDGEIAVRTFQFTAGGNNEPSDSVAFVIFIP